METKEEMELKQLEAQLHFLCYRLQELNDLMERSKRFKSPADAELQKRIEDGIISHIHNANPYQLATVLSRRNDYFKYYSEIYDLIENGVEFETIAHYSHIANP